MAAKPFIFICGADDFLVEREGRARWEEMTREIDDDYCKEVVDGRAGKVDEVGQAVGSFLSAVQTLPMFGDAKAVWLKGVDFLGDSVVGRSETTKAQVAALTDALEALDGEATPTLVTASPVDRRKKEFKRLQSLSDFTFIESKNAVEAAARAAADEAARLGATLAPEAAETLAMKINGNARLAVEETRKLFVYVGGEGARISEKDVIEVCPNFGEGDFFEASEAFFSGDLNRALDAIRGHFFSGYDARPLITSLQNRNRLLIQLRALIDAGELRGSLSNASLQRAEKRFGAPFARLREKSGFNVFTQNPWYLGRLSEPANRFSLKRLIRLQEDIARAFEQLIRRPSEQEQVIRELAIRTMG